VSGGGGLTRKGGFSSNADRNEALHPVPAGSHSRPFGRVRRAPPHDSVAQAFEPPPEVNVNAFSALFPERARRLEARPFERQALFAGAQDDVEEVSAGSGRLWAVVHRGDPLAEGGQALAFFTRRPDAHLAAATFTALATPSRLTLNPHMRKPENRRHLGYPIHDGAHHLGHLARYEEGCLVQVLDAIGWP